MYSLCGRGQKHHLTDLIADSSMKHLFSQAVESRTQTRKPYTNRNTESRYHKSDIIVIYTHSLVQTFKRSSQIVALAG